MEEQLVFKEKEWKNASKELEEKEPVLLEKIVKLKASFEQYEQVEMLLKEIQKKSSEIKKMEREINDCQNQQKVT